MPTAKALQDKRREARHKQAIYDLLVSINQPPFGLHASKEADRPLSDLWTTPAAETSCQATEKVSSNDQQPMAVDWSQMPPSCDPVALLDNNQNTIRKKGMPIDQQIAMLEFMPSVKSTATDGEAGQGSEGPASRGQQKRWQVESFACVLRVLLGSASAHHTQPTGNASHAPHSVKGLTVVDFGCGTGGLLLPLARLFPHCHFTGVEMKRPALKILEQRASLARLTNVSTYHGMIEQYQGPVDVALALHACGNATDQVLLLAEQKRAAVVVCPCCVGKLKFSLSGGSSFSPNLTVWHGVQQASKGQDPRVLATPTTTPAPPQSPPQPATHIVQNGQLKTDISANGHSSISGNYVHASVGVGAGNGVGVGGEAAAPAAALPALNHPRSAALRSLFPDSERTFALMASIADFNAPHRATQTAPTHTSSATTTTTTTRTTVDGGRHKAPGNQSTTQTNTQPTTQPTTQSGSKPAQLSSASASGHTSSAMPVHASVARGGEQDIGVVSGGAAELSARVNGVLSGCVGDAGVRINGHTHTSPAPTTHTAPANHTPSHTTGTPSAVCHTGKDDRRRNSCGHSHASGVGVHQSDMNGNMGADSDASTRVSSVLSGGLHTHASDMDSASNASAMSTVGLDSSASDSTRVSGVLSLSLEELGSLCKLHVELDRREALREAGFHSALFRVLHAGETAKGDMLVGVPSESPTWKHCHALLA